MSDIISEDIFTTYNGFRVTDEGTQVTTGTALSGFTTDQAQFERAYVTKDYVETKNVNGIEQHLQEGLRETILLWKLTLRKLSYLLTIVP